MVSNRSVYFAFALVALWIAAVSVTGIKWNGLRATYNFNPLSRYSFDRLPRTAVNAVRDGFEKIDDCSSSALWRGLRFMKNDDPALMLLYDVNGFIAGMQTSLPKNLPTGYPVDGQMPPFVEDRDDRYVMTVYFVDPATICTTGRTDTDYQRDGTGTNLYVQNGTNPEADYFIMPRREKDIVNTKWTLGKCFPFMGNHYWYDISYNMDCNDVYPIFPLYNRGELTAFGFILMANLPSPRYEVPPSLVYRNFFLKVPQCAYFIGKISSIHVYFTNNVFRNWCGPVNIKNMD